MACDVNCHLTLSCFFTLPQQLDSLAFTSGTVQYGTHLRTVQHNYSVVRVLCTVRAVHCTRTFLLHKSGEALSPDLSIGAFASHFFCTAVQYCSTVYRYTVQTRTVHLSILRCTGK